MKNLKKKGKMLLCLTLVLSMLAGLLVIGARQGWQQSDLGALSEYYEIGAVGGTGDPGYYSDVPGDPGGPSYGIYMFATNAGVPYEFAKWLKDSDNQVYRDMGVRLVDAYEKNIYGEISPGYGSNFKNTWQSIAANNKSGFYQAQKDYWQSKYYDELVLWAKSTYDLDVSDYGIALKNVFWSRSVHHGLDGAQGIITRAMTSLGGFKYQSEAELISAIYGESGRLATAEEVAEKNMTKTMSGSTAERYGTSGKVLRYFYGSSGAVQMSVYTRLVFNEPHDALTMLHQNRSAAALLPDGTYIMKDNANQNRWLTAEDTVSAETEVDNKMVLTWYEGGFYTITCGTERLTGTTSGALFDAPAKNTAQFWVLTDSGSGYVLQNKSTGLYLTVAESGSALGASSDEAQAAHWHFAHQGDVTLRNAMLPGADNNLTKENSSYPLRGILTCALPMTKVTIEVKTESGVIVSNCSPSQSGLSTTFFDLWELDGNCSISQLDPGKYTLSVKVTVSGENQAREVAVSNFIVGVKSTTVPPAAETFTVTFDANGGTCSTTSKTYELGQVYGELPIPVKSDGRFLGWFKSDGSQIAASTPVGAEDHTVTAKYGSLYTVTFKPDNGTADEIRYLAEGDLIVAPSEPMKAPDSQYTYSFSHWMDANGKQFVDHVTYMGAANATYTAVYTQQELPSQPTTPSDPTTPPKPVDGGNLTGIAPKTDATALTKLGYTVYSGDQVITSGNVGTGMKAVVNNVSMTIVVTGDLSGDGKITVTDVVKLQSHIMKKTMLDGVYATAADLNGDGKITVTDVVQATQYVLGKRS